MHSASQWIILGAMDKVIEINYVHLPIHKGAGTVRIILLNFLLFIMFSCVGTERVSCDFLATVRKSQPPATAKLRRYEAYHLRKPPYHIGLDFIEGKPTRIVTTPYLHAPVFFFANGNVLRYGVLAPDSLHFGKFVNHGYKEKYSGAECGICWYRSKES